MANTKISAAVPAGTLTGTELLPLAKTGDNTPYNTPVDAIAARTITQITAADIYALDFSGLPTSYPGPGLLWLNGGVLQVGP